MSELPTEVMLSRDELKALYPGLRDMRFRKDGKLAVGLFLRNTDHRPVLAVSAIDSRSPYVFPIPPEAANPAFEHPYKYADKAARLIIEDTLGEFDRHQNSKAA